MCIKGDQSNHTKSPWQKTPVANLVRHVQSGNYYARIRVRGKLIWKSLKTDRICVAKLRLSDFHKEERQRSAAHSAVARGKMVFSQALETYRERLTGDQPLKDRSKVYREERISALLRSWPELQATDVAQISKADCLSWAARFGQKASPSAFNNTVGTLKLVLDIAVEAGARYDNPVVHVKRKKIRQKLLHLPSKDQFLKLAETIRNADGGYSSRLASPVCHSLHRIRRGHSHGFPLARSQGRRGACDEDLRPLARPTFRKHGSEGRIYRGIGTCCSAPASGSVSMRRGRSSRRCWKESHSPSQNEIRLSLAGIEKRDGSSLGPVARGGSNRAA